MISAYLLKIVLFLISFKTSICGGYKTNLETDLENSDRRHCDSEIYCYGTLLHDVQMSGVFEDGSVFVRKGLRYPEKYILKKYETLREKTNGTPTAQQLRVFIDEYFINDTLPACKFPDFTTNPSILSKTKNKQYKKWLSNLNTLWNNLGGYISEEVKMHPSRHSFLYVPNKFIKAGGRFEETYYWDSFWIVKGLLLCDMYDSARGIIENIISLINMYSHMPNGNRIYYVKRSQPPMLVHMAYLYYEHTQNFTFIENNINAFNVEFHWWMEHRQVKVIVNGKSHYLYSYNSTSYTPRPESYKEDYTLIEELTNEEEIRKILTGIKSAAESGWDFSSRHVRGLNNSNIGSLTQMEPQNMVYVDLNSMMHFNARTLKDWYTQLGDTASAMHYKNIEDSLLEGIENVLWNDAAGVWQDYDLITRRHRNYFYISNFTPLWSKSFTKKDRVDKAIEYLVSEGVITPDYNPIYYCIPTSTYNSTQQWDFPNCWPPLQAFVIHGLQQNSDLNSNAKEIAFKLAQNWIDTTYAGYYNKRVMYEKYDATKLGCSGKGGEYKPQTGFGWTNGFTMDLFNYWGEQFELKPTPAVNC